jgi:photosystem II stability/assembly factor-like uncharacterized protein
MSPKINRILIPFIVLFFLSHSKQTISTGQASAYSSYMPVVSNITTGWIGPTGGTIIAVAINPSNPQVVYAGSFGSGVFKSTDGGDSWKPVNQGMTNLYIYSLAIDPKNPDILYAGTYHSQVYKSQNGGISWTWSGSGIQDQAVVYSIAIDPIDPYRLYAATRGVSNNGYAPWNGAVYKSINGGQSWTPSLWNVGTENVQDWVYSLAVNPNAPNQVFAATHENNPWRSDDYGTTWHVIYEGINDPSGRAIVISPQNSSILYFGVWHFDSAYKSFNSGDQWSGISDGFPYVKVYSMAIDPYNPNSVYMATFSHGLLKTTNGGSSWQYAGLQTDFLYSVAISPLSTNNLFVGTNGDGLYRSVDNSSSWQAINNGINNATVTSVVHSPLNPAMVYASVYGAGVYKSINRGQTWDTINTGLGDKFVHDLVMDPAHPELLYALTDSGGLFQNDVNSSKGWISIGGELPQTRAPMPAFPVDHPFATLDMQESFTYPQETLSANQKTSVSLLKMVYAPSNPQIAYIGTRGSGVYRSENAGLDWHPTALSGQTVLSLAVDRNISDLVYVATDDLGSFMVSFDGGGSWSNISLPLYFYSLAASQTESGVVYAGTSNGIYQYQSGEWTILGLSNQSVTAIALDPDTPGVIYAGTTSGAYYSTDNGLTWNWVDPQLSGITIQSINFDPFIPNVVYFSTKTHGIFQSTFGY